MQEVAREPRLNGGSTMEQNADGGLVLRVPFVRVRDGCGYALLSPAEVPVVPVPQRGPRRVARLLAFAHHTERRIADGEIADRAAAARELGVTRARLTQILDLALLAPDIQEEILAGEVEPGYDPINERALRWVVRARDWPTQRDRWRDLQAV
jgi:hypothetical protein